jgi:hypothetical protein
MHTCAGYDDFNCALLKCILNGVRKVGSENSTKVEAVGVIIITVQAET